MTAVVDVALGGLVVVDTGGRVDVVVVDAGARVVVVDVVVV